MIQDPKLRLKAWTDVKIANVHGSLRLLRQDWFLCILQGQSQPLFFSLHQHLLCYNFCISPSLSPHVNESTGGREKPSHEAQTAQGLQCISSAPRGAEQ